MVIDDKGLMGKNKRQKLQSSSSKKSRSIANGARPTSISKPQPKSSKHKPHIQIQHTLPTIPFTPTDRILLIGEGDLSFARSLVEHLGYANVTATVYESREELEEKYPVVGANIKLLEERGAVVRYGQ